MHLLTTICLRDFLVIGLYVYSSLTLWGIWYLDSKTSTCFHCPDWVYIEKDSVHGQAMASLARVVSPPLNYPAHKQIIFTQIVNPNNYTQIGCKYINIDCKHITIIHNYSQIDVNIHKYKPIFCCWVTGQ